MLGNKAHSLLNVFLLGELAEGQCHYFEKQWHPCCVFLAMSPLLLSHPSLLWVVPEGDHLVLLWQDTLCSHRPLPAETLPRHERLLWGAALPQALVGMCLVSVIGRQVASSRSAPEDAS